MDTVRKAIHSAQPARAALAALVAFHALRSGQLASLELTDVRDGWLQLEGRVIPLADPSASGWRPSSKSVPATGPPR